MPANLSTDPLVTLPFRVRRSIFDAIAREADELGRTKSYVLRARLDLPNSPPLDKPPPRRRVQPTLGSVSRADPELVRQIAAVGSNLNQLARAVNSKAIAGIPAESVMVLARLLSVERQLNEILRCAAKKSNDH